MTEEFTEFQTATWLIYGETKVGKTTLLSTAPTPGVVLDIEGKWHFFAQRINPNTGEKFRLKYWDPSDPPPKADGTWDFCIVKATDIKKFELTNQWIEQRKHPFVSCCLDSLTVTQEHMLQGINADQPRIQDWGTLRRQMVQYVTNMTRCASDPANPLRVFAATSHGTLQQDGKYVPTMQGGAKDRIPYQFDCVAYAGKARKKNQDGSSDFVYRLLVKSHPEYTTGSNFEDLFDKPAYDNPNLTRLMRTIFPK